MVAAACWGVSGPNVRAAVVTTVGVDLGVAGTDNDSVEQFRSTSAVKALDVGSADNVYGSDGYVVYATAAA